MSMVLTPRFISIKNWIDYNIVGSNHEILSYNLNLQRNTNNTLDFKPFIIFLQG